MDKQGNFSLGVCAAAILMAFPPASAWADEVEELTNPNLAEVSVGLRYLNEANPLYRQYTGMNTDGASGTLGMDYLRRNDEAEWFRLNARDLGTRVQEFGISYEKQGDWAIGLEYDQIPRFGPYEIHTGVTGIGTNTVQQGAAQVGYAPSAAGLSETTLSTERSITTFSGKKYLSDRLKLSFSLKNEDKTGERMFGVRGGGSSTTYPFNAFLFAPEPIDQTHRQIEGAMDYVTEKYQLSVGYYGSFLEVDDPAFNVAGNGNVAYFSAATGGTAGSPGVFSLASPLALAPSNSMQQIYANGAYNFSADTRGTLKVSHSEGRQDDDFITLDPRHLSPAIGGGLDAKVKTTEIYASLTSRVTKDLKLLASWRYEDKDDDTPVRAYNTWIKGGYDSFKTNNPISHEAQTAKLEADYRLAKGYALTAGVDYTTRESSDWNYYHNANSAPDLAWGRSEVSETTSRVSLRKNMSETVNANLALSHAVRTGSDWEHGSHHVALYPTFLADRNRDKVRGMVDWAASERLNLQFAYEAYFDDYTRSEYGMDSGKGQVFSLDGAFDLDDDWKLNAWYSKQLGETEQHTQGAACTTVGDGACTGTGATTFRTGTLIQWDSKLKQDSDQLGLGLTGRFKKLEVGAQYVYFHDLGEQDISEMPATTCTNLACTTTGVVASGMGILPDTRYTQNTLKLYGAYPLDKATKVRLDFIYDYRKMDDYTWENWVYADGTRVNVDPKQITQIIGLSLIHKF